MDCDFGVKGIFDKIEKSIYEDETKFLVFWLVPVNVDMKARMSSDVMAERIMSPKYFWTLPRMNSKAVFSARNIGHIEKKHALEI